MNFYVAVITDMVDYIEQNLSAKLSLGALSTRAGISDFHFNRIFKAVTGQTLKQYILGRKLCAAAEQLSNTARSVIDIALDLGFEYPEVFSRAFKAHTGVSPAVFREYPAASALTPKASVVERDIINYRGTLALKGDIRFFEPLCLRGIHTDANENDDDFQQKLRRINGDFLLGSAHLPGFLQDCFYTAVTCSGLDDGGYHVFCGRQPVSQTFREYDALEVPGGWYADFLYHGDMFDIREVFIDDLYKWIMVKELKLLQNGIGMLNIYPGGYPKDPTVHIRIPLQQGQ